MTVVGFIGLGSQGGPMARRIVESGYPLVLWARRAAALEAFRDTPAVVVESVAEMGTRCGHVGVCVVDDAGVIEVCHELIATMRSGSRIAIHSTVRPATVVELARQAATRGISVIDAPVSGGGPAAAAGKLTLMIGADEQVAADARPIFETFAGLIVRLGGVGTGQMAKLVNNALMAVNVAVAHQGLAAGAALGLDRAALCEIVKVSSGRSYGFEVYSRLPSPSAFSHGAKLLHKDVRLLGELLGENPAFAAFRDITGPFLELAQQQRS
jgi:3-hydroxyisobutyrate dehydrogenase-like beta-hydroxyacid dehydrogenase